MTKEKTMILNKKTTVAEKPCGCRERERERESSSLENKSFSLYLVCLILSFMHKKIQNRAKTMHYVNNCKESQNNFTNSFFKAYTRSVGYIVVTINRLTNFNCKSICREKVLANTS